MNISSVICDENSWLADLKNEITIRRDMAVFSDVIYRNKFVQALLNISDVLSNELLSKYKDIGASTNVIYLDTKEDYVKFIKHLETDFESIYKTAIASRVDACTQLLVLITAVLNYDVNVDVIKLIKRLTIRTGKSNYLPNFGL